MLPKHLVFVLVAQVISCAQRRLKHNNVSSSVGPYSFAMNSDAPYVPQVQEPAVDSTRRVEMLTDSFKASHFSATAPVEETEMQVESEVSGPVKVSSPKELKEPILVAVQDPTPEPRQSLKDIKISSHVDMGKLWDEHQIQRCETRVVIFGVRTSNIRDVLHVMIKFGPITHAWMIDEMRYNRPNIVFVEYAKIEDAEKAISEARSKFVSRVGVAPCKGVYNRRQNRIKLTFKPGSLHLDEYMKCDVLEKKFGPVVDLAHNWQQGVTYIVFNWTMDADNAAEFFRKKRCHISR